MKNPFQALIESQLMNFQEGLSRAIEELQAMEMEGSAGGGAVVVRITGLGEVTEVKIDPAIVNPDDMELLNDLVCAGVRDAIRKATETKKAKIAQATPLGAMGIDLPDMF
jgi:nucleoid-associated protein EbfC